MKKVILFVFPGPKDDVVEAFKDRVTELSSDFQGYVLTASYDAVDTNVAGFRLISNKESDFRSLSTIKGLARRASSLCAEAAALGKPVELVVSYDPLTTGAIGLYVAKKYNAKLLVEVNGDYGAKDTYADIANPVKRLVTRFRNWVIMSCVLYKADGVKCLYDSQTKSVPPFCVPPIHQAFPNYTDLSQFIKHDCNWGKTILFVGFPFRLKGVDLLISAFRNISERFPEWKLKLIGWYPDREEIERAIGGHPNITLSAPMERGLIAKEMVKASIFVLPSRSEAMGRVLLEAASVGLARVGSTAGGIPNVISDNDDGLLFESGSSDDLQEKLLMLLESEELRKRLGKNAKRKVLDGKFSKETYYKNADSLYHNVIENR